LFGGRSGRSGWLILADADVDVLDSIVRLVDRSLITYEPESGRYRLLETVMTPWLLDGQAA
jgi:hypothetical protein